MPRSARQRRVSAVEDGVEDGLQVVRRVRNGAQHFRDGRLLLDEFGHPILRLRSGPFSVDTLAHVKQFLGLDGEGSITAPAAVRDSSYGRLNRTSRPNIRRLLRAETVPIGCRSARLAYRPLAPFAGRDLQCPVYVDSRAFSI